MIDLDGYKLFAGSHSDPPFGPVVLSGFGGRLTDVFKDRAYGSCLDETRLAYSLDPCAKFRGKSSGMRWEHSS